MGNVVVVMFVCCYQFFEWIFVVEWYQFVVQFVVGCVQIYCQGYVQVGVELINFGNYFGGGQCDVVFVDVVVQVVMYQVYGGQYWLIVQQWFVYVYYYYIGDWVFVQVFVWVEGMVCLLYLVDDF